MRFGYDICSICELTSLRFTFRNDVALTVRALGTAWKLFMCILTDQFTICRKGMGCNGKDLAPGEFTAENKVIQRKSILWGEECIQWQRAQTS